MGGQVYGWDNVRKDRAQGVFKKLRDASDEPA
jgi:hypothetical protein